MSAIDRGRRRKEVRRCGTSRPPRPAPGLLCAHRDELYFLAAGRHLAWGYADQGPLTPLIARVMSALDGTSLTVLRVPAALMTGGTTLLTGKLAREFGGRPRGQALATACAGCRSSCCSPATR